MAFSSFFFGPDGDHDFKKNDDLSQGKAFLHYENEVKSKTFKRLPFLELTSMPGLTSINEAFIGDDSLRSTPIIDETDYSSLISAYEQHFSELLVNYEQVHAKYINSLRLKDKEQSKILLSQLKRLDEDMQNYSAEISQKTKKMNKPAANYQDIINKKQKDLGVLHKKLREKEQTINELVSSTNGKNESLHLQIKSSVYYNTLYLIIIFIIGWLIIRYFVLSDSTSNPAETIVLLLTIVLILYEFRNTVVGWMSSAASVGNSSYSTMVRFLE